MCGDRILVCALRIGVLRHPIQASRSQRQPEFDVRWPDFCVRGADANRSSVYADRKLLSETSTWHGLAGLEHGF